MLFLTTQKCAPLFLYRNEDPWIFLLKKNNTHLLTATPSLHRAGSNTHQVIGDITGELIGYRCRQICPHDLLDSKNSVLTYGNLQQKQEKLQTQNSEKNEATPPHKTNTQKMRKTRFFAFSSSFPKVGWENARKLWPVVPDSSLESIFSDLFRFSFEHFPIFPLFLATPKISEKFASMNDQENGCSTGAARLTGFQWHFCSSVQASEDTYLIKFSTYHNYLIQLINLHFLSQTHKK